ncbi:MAG: DUF3604 domain-containing protein [bacterium]|nr:DUF3604 domain-containing protein [bacterium]
MIRSLVLVVLGLVLISVGLLVGIRDGAFGVHSNARRATQMPVPEERVTERTEFRAAVSNSMRGAEANGGTQILFGDLHVHTTFSADAFQLAMPIAGGEGAKPAADACDFARFCSGLDFWAISDHAEQLTPRHWSETIDAVRQCDAIASDPNNPDLVSFLGWEWTQIGETPETHYGHKNIILRGLEARDIPTRPIGASGLAASFSRNRSPLASRVLPLLLDWPHRRTYLDLARYQEDLLAIGDCARGVDVHELPSDCMEVAATPEELFEKLEQWGVDALVIPHGTTWGEYTPLGLDFADKLTPAQHNSAREKLIEVYSGHGNAEEYRSWRHTDLDDEGRASCPEPTDNFLPCCWRAGELIAERCGEISPEACGARVHAARRNFLNAGIEGMRTVSGATAEEWLGCGSDRTLFNPAGQYRPGGSVQYSLAISGQKQNADPLRYRWGFIASSDTHRARPGNGYKDRMRRRYADIAGAPDERFSGLIPGTRGERSAKSIPAEQLADVPLFARPEFERQSSYFLTGGLAAVHSKGRDRNSIWQALQTREVYGTSGPKILLWFDLLNGPDGRKPMGSDVAMLDEPWFRVRAAGAQKQKPGCPEHAERALTSARLEQICRGECDNPGDDRYVITRIEIVRIRPQLEASEAIPPLIEDPWLKLACDGDSEGCVVDFRDPEYISGKREFIYYARAIQEPSAAVNAAGERCEYDEDGRCLQVSPCYGDYRTDFDDDCLAPNEERAWSSPIYLRPVRGPVSNGEI